MMGFQDDYFKLLRDQTGFGNSFSEMHRQMLEAERLAFKNLLNEQAFSASKAVGKMLAQIQEQPRDLFKGIGEGIGASPLNDFGGFRMAGMLAEPFRLGLAVSNSEGFGFSAIKALTEIANSIKPFQPESFTNILGGIRAETFKGIGGFAESAAFAAMGSFQPKMFESVQASFARSMADAFRAAFEGSEENKNAFEPVQQLIEDKVAELPHNRVAAEGLWRIVYEVLLALLAMGQVGIGLYQINDAKQTSATQTAQFNQFMAALQRIASNTENLIPKQDQNTYYVVERTVELRNKPNNRSTVISTLSPNQKVRLIQINHQWIYVEYFDYLEGVPKNGWAMKKYLKRLDQ